MSNGVASLDARFELAPANILALSKGNVQRLAVDHSLVHLSDSLGGFIRAAEADETETLALSEDLLLGLLVVFALGLLFLFGLFFGLLLGLLGLLSLTRLLLVFTLALALDALDVGGVTHHLGGGDGTVRTEQLTQLLVVNIVREVLDVEVDTLVFGGLLQTGSFILSTQVLLTLVLLLSTTNVQPLALNLLVVHVLRGGLRTFVGGVVDETETTALAILVTAQSGRGDFTELLEEGTELLVGDLGVNVLDVDVGEVGLHLLELALAVLLGDVVADENLLVVQKHTVDVLDGVVGSLGSFVVDETVALGVGKLILGNLAAKNVTKGGKGVVESLVIDGAVEVLDEDVALASLAQSGVTLRPHDTAGLALDQGVVQVLEGTLTIGGVVVVDVGISERATGNGVTADTDGSDLANRGEKLVEHGLGHGGVEFTNVERSRVRLAGGGAFRSSSLRSRVGGSRAGGLGGAVDRVVSGGVAGNFGRHVDFDFDLFFFFCEVNGMISIRL